MGDYVGGKKWLPEFSGRLHTGSQETPGDSSNVLDLCKCYPPGLPLGHRVLLCKL